MVRSLARAIDNVNPHPRIKSSIGDRLPADSSCEQNNLLILGPAEKLWVPRENALGVEAGGFLESSVLRRKMQLIVGLLHGFAATVGAMRGPKNWMFCASRYEFRVLQKFL